MAGLGIDGLVSNFDSSAIIDALLKVERRPIDGIKLRQTNDNTRIQAYQQLSAHLLSLSVAAGRLGNVNLFQSREASSSRPSIVGVSVDSSAVEGTYIVNVLQLARAEQVTSDAFANKTAARNLSGEILVNGVAVRINAADSLEKIAAAINAVNGVNAGVVRLADGDYRLSITAAQTGAEKLDLRNVGGGTILQDLGIATAATSLRAPVTGGFQSAVIVGKANPVRALLNLNTPLAGSFVINDGNGNDVAVTVDLATDSLEAVAAKIQQASDQAGAGLTATVVQDTGGYRLRVVSNDGASVVSDDAGLLQTLGVLKPAYKHQTADQTGRNARFTVNGLEFERASNFVNDVIGGVTLTLLDDSNPTANPQIAVRTRRPDIAPQIQGIVDAFNSARSLIAQATRYNAETREAGVLLGDATLRSISRELNALVQTRVPRALGVRLADLNNGAGVAPGSIKITNSAGNETIIDLSGATTLQDVVNRINNSSAKVTAAIAERSGANPDFDPSLPESPTNRRIAVRSGLVLTDNAGGTRALRVENVGAGTTASDLGIAGSAAGRQLFGEGLTAQTGAISLADIGVRLTDTGSLTFNSAALQEQLNRDPAAVAALFTAPEIGVSARFAKSLGFITHPVRGSINARVEGLRESIDAGNDAIARIEERVEQVETRLRRQFTQLETTLSQLRRTGDYVLTQLQNLGNIFQNTRSRR